MAEIVRPKAPPTLKVEVPAFLLAFLFDVVGNELRLSAQDVLYWSEQSMHPVLSEMLMKDPYMVTYKFGGMGAL